jgi:hypothetical protein
LILSTLTTLTPKNSPNYQLAVIQLINLNTELGKAVYKDKDVDYNTQIGQ